MRIWRTVKTARNRKKYLSFDNQRNTNPNRLEDWTVKCVNRFLAALVAALVTMLVARSVSAQQYREVPCDGGLCLMIEQHVPADTIVRAYDGVYRKSLEDAGELEEGEHLTFEKIYRVDENSAKLIPVCLDERGLAKRVGQRGDDSVWRNCDRPSWVPIPKQRIRIPTQQVVSYQTAKAFYTDVRSCLKRNDCTIVKVTELLGAKAPMDAPKNDAKKSDAGSGDSSAVIAKLNDRIAELTTANETLTSERDTAKRGRKDAEDARDTARSERDEAVKNRVGMPVNNVVAAIVITILAAIGLIIIFYRRAKERGKKAERKIANAQLGTMQLDYEERVTDLRAKLERTERELEEERRRKLAPNAPTSSAGSVANAVAMAASVAAIASVSTMGSSVPSQPVDEFPPQVLAPALAKTVPAPEAAANGNGARTLMGASLNWTPQERDAYYADKRARNAGIPVVASAKGNGRYVSITVDDDDPKDVEIGTLKRRVELLIDANARLIGEKTILEQRIAGLEQKQQTDDAELARLGEDVTQKERELAVALAAKDQAEGDLAAARLSRERLDEQMSALRAAWHDQRRAVIAHRQGDDEDPLSCIGYADDPTLGGRPRGMPALDVNVAQWQFNTAFATLINEGTTPQSVAEDLRLLWQCTPPVGAPPPVRDLPDLGDIDDEETTVSGSKPPSSDPLTFSLGGVGLGAVFQRVAAASRMKPSDGPPPKGRTAIPPARVPVKQEKTVTEPSVSGVRFSSRKGDTLPPPPPLSVGPRDSSAAIAVGDGEPSDQRVTLDDVRGHISRSGASSAGDDAEPPAIAGAKV